MRIEIGEAPCISFPNQIQITFYEDHGNTFLYGDLNDSKRLKNCRVSLAYHALFSNKSIIE